MLWARLAVFALVFTACAQAQFGGNATLIRGKRICNPLTFTDTHVLTWDATLNCYKNAAGGAGGGITDVFAGPGVSVSVVGDAATVGLDPAASMLKSTASGAPTLPLAGYAYGDTIRDSSTTPPTLYFCTTSDGTGCTAVARMERLRSFGATFDGGGSALVAGATVVRYLVVPFACTVTSWDVMVDAGTAGFRVWRIATGTAIPTAANTVTSVGDLAIASGTALHSTTATNWSAGAFPTIAANDIIGIHLNASATATLATLGVQCRQ